MTTVTFRTEEDVKNAAKKLFADLGLDMTTAINMFLRQAIVDRGMPFRATLDSQENIIARAQAETKQGKTFKSVDALMDDLLNA